MRSCRLLDTEWSRRVRVVLRRPVLLVVLATCCVLCAALMEADPAAVLTGTTIWKRAETWDGLTFYGAADGTLALIDMDGNIVNRWVNPDPKGGRLSTAEPVRGQPGHVLAKQNLPGPEGGAPPRGGALLEMDWDGNVVWEMPLVESLGKGEIAGTVEWHHDQERLANGNTLILCELDILVPQISPNILRDPCVVEVTPNQEIVWQWHLFEHFDELGFSDEERELIAEAKLDYAHANSVEVIPENSHLSPEMAPGNVLVSLRSMNMIIIIDRDTDEIVWKVRDLTIGQHWPYMIPPGLPGEGNILIYDNGQLHGYPEKYRLESRVVEINPVTRRPVAVMTAENLGRPPEFLQAQTMGGAQRLGNGNTLVVEPPSGRIFEVNAAMTDIVWEYVTPLAWLRDQTPDGGFKTVVQYVYRAYRVPVSWVP